MAEAIIKKRIMEREKVLDKARLFAQCVRERMGSNTTIILYGSYARGDFSEESDIDILVITNSNLPLEPHYRIDLILECIKKFPEVEPVILTIREVEERYRKSNPLILEALDQGIYLLDGLGLKNKFSLQARRQAQAR